MFKLKQPSSFFLLNKIQSVPWIVRAEMALRLTWQRPNHKHFMAFFFSIWKMKHVSFLDVPPLPFSAHMHKPIFINHTKSKCNYNYIHSGRQRHISWRAVKTFVWFSKNKSLTWFAKHLKFHLRWRFSLQHSVTQSDLLLTVCSVLIRDISVDIVFPLLVRDARSTSCMDNFITP